MYSTASPFKKQAVGATVGTVYRSPDGCQMNVWADMTRPSSLAPRPVVQYPNGTCSRATHIGSGLHPPPAGEDCCDSRLNSNEITSAPSFRRGLGRWAELGRQIVGVLMAGEVDTDPVAVAARAAIEIMLESAGREGVAPGPRGSGIYERLLRRWWESDSLAPPLPDVRRRAATGW